MDSTIERTEKLSRTTVRATRGPVALAALALAAASVLTAQGTAHAAYDRATVSIWDGEQLPNTDAHIDNKGQFGTARLIMQSDGNLVAYYAPDNDFSRQQPTWATGTVGCGAKAVVRTDGNLVVLDASGGLCWESGTAGHPHARVTLWRNADVLITDTCNRTLFERQPGITYVPGQTHGGLVSPSSVESPYVVLPPPTGC
ncbi:hypothetical protein [Kitasatospora sp. CB02891]|uniref:hypothetical protein n=1 Tax=Kitasatospora sp. CB02891 TaxID=2020329 RepID=UPI000C276086|nr:hypothetical protein [Kitasatospora sp. CB02891]PJN26161.1 hypothetical protein CG736_12310 [Kitasatospora sp. CB02891]